MKNEHSYLIYNASIKLYRLYPHLFANKIFPHCLVIDDKILFEFLGFDSKIRATPAYHKQDWCLCLISHKDDFSSLNQALFKEEKIKALYHYNHLQSFFYQSHHKERFLEQ